MDVSLIRAEGRLQIVTRIGKTLMVKSPYKVLEDRITFNDSSKPTNVLKSEIARIYKIAAKPLTAKGEYVAQELGPMIIFDPQLCTVFTSKATFLSCSTVRMNPKTTHPFNAGTILSLVED